MNAMEDKELRERKNEWESMTPEEYVKLPRHGFVEEGIDNYHLRNIKWMIAQASEEEGRKLAEEIVKKAREETNHTINDAFDQGYNQAIINRLPNLVSETLTSRYGKRPGAGEGDDGL